MSQQQHSSPLLLLQCVSLLLLCVPFCSWALLFSHSCHVTLCGPHMPPGGHSMPPGLPHAFHMAHVSLLFPQVLPGSSPGTGWASPVLHKAHRPPVCPGHRWPRTTVWKEQGQLSGRRVEKPKASRPLSRGMGSTQTHQATDVVAGGCTGLFSPAGHGEQDGPVGELGSVTSLSSTRPHQ